jgi:hypothetical protein
MCSMETLDIPLGAEWRTLFYHKCKHTGQLPYAYLGCPRKCFFNSGGTRNFLKTYGIPRYFYSKIYPEFRGIPCVFVYGIPQVTK